MLPLLQIFRPCKTIKEIKNDCVRLSQDYIYSVGSTVRRYKTKEQLSTQGWKANKIIFGFIIDIQAYHLGVIKFSRGMNVLSHFQRPIYKLIWEIKEGMLFSSIDFRTWLKNILMSTIMLLWWVWLDGS